MDYRTFHEVFDTLSDEAKQSFDTRNTPEVVELSPIDHYATKISSTLWGLSSPDWPITPESAHGIIAQSLPACEDVVQGTRREGLTQRLRPIRESLFDSVMQNDKGFLE